MSGTDLPSIQANGSAASNESRSGAIGSFHPIFSAFGPHWITHRLDVDDVYFLRGDIPPNVVNCVSSYAKRIHHFTLREPVESDARKIIDPGAYLRLVYLLSQAVPGPLFSSLKSLRVDRATSSLDHLNLFLTPSLRELELGRVPQSHHLAISVFLETLVEEAPNLTQVILGPGPICVDWWKTCSKFSNLQSLKIASGSAVSLGYDLLRIWGDLPILESLDLDAISSTHYRNRPAVLLAERAISPLPKRARNDSVPMSPPSSPVSPRRYSRLKQLSVEGSVEVIDDLLGLISSQGLQRLTLHLITFRNSLHEDSTQYLALVNKYSGKWVNSLENINLKLTQGTRSYPNSSPSAAPAGNLTDFVYPKLSSETFIRLIQPVHLSKLSVSGLSLEHTPLNQLLSERRTNLKDLMLPINEDTPCIPLVALRDIAETCPSFERLRCGVDLSTDLPDDAQFPPGTNALSHGLSSLFTGKIIQDGRPAPSNTALLKIARYLNVLFPKLIFIHGFATGADYEQWKYISDLVKLCQDARSDDRFRAPSNRL